jgi:hypothetical protein
MPRRYEQLVSNTTLYIISIVAIQAFFFGVSIVVPNTSSGEDSSIGFSQLTGYGILGGSLLTFVGVIYCLENEELVLSGAGAGAD